ncbi:DUF2628 domain-containing protein [Acinetobacter sp. 194]|uniref:DUF2628 domain-containing protein n=1 Tax=Acinetobacter shaoyimingii TaxID=2715164 RepID=UPI00140A41D5|nr:DUF2628 domain-containing protein [Acinetobacter shaoyimingii]NHB56599.1 DUF2628 domain-containing protein [Acinetobacter shaoyimingii]
MNEQQEYTPSNNQKSDSPFAPVVNLDDQRQAIFVGKKYETYYQEKFNQITPKKQMAGFNIGAFFFGLMWLFYRKMYGYGLILLGLILVSCVIPIPEAIDRGISIALAVTMGMFGNTLYKNFVEKKIKEIERSHPDSIEQELERQGGTNIWAGIGILFVAVIAIYIVVTISGNY